MSDPSSLSDQSSQRFDINRVIADARQVLTAPATFYQTLAKSGGYAEPIIFIAVMAAVTGLIGAILSLFGGGQMGAVQMGLASVIIMPIVAVIGAFIGAAILFVIWKLMGSTESYETAFRCLAFATAIYPVVAVIGIIPYLASIVGVAWFSYLMIEASTHVHGLTRQKATVVFAVIAVLLILSNISSERMARNMESQFGQLGRDMEELQNLPPEEAGRRLGEFFKGMEEAMQQSASE